MRPTSVLIAAATVAVALPASALGLGNFTSPSRNIDCVGGGDFVSCVVQKADWPRVPPRPASCELEWVGTELGLFRKHVTVGACRGDIGPMCVPGVRCPVLPYGASRTFGATRCTSRTNGITCRRLTGRRIGFRVARQGYVIFR